MNDLVDMEQRLLNELNQANNDIMDAKRQFYVRKKKAKDDYAFSLLTILKAKGFESIDATVLCSVDNLKSKLYNDNDLDIVKSFIDEKFK